MAETLTRNSAEDQNSATGWEKMSDEVRDFATTKLESDFAAPSFDGENRAENEKSAEDLDVKIDKTAGEAAVKMTGDQETVAQFGEEDDFAKDEKILADWRTELAGKDEEISRVQAMIAGGRENLIPRLEELTKKRGEMAESLRNLENEAKTAREKAEKAAISDETWEEPDARNYDSYGEDFDAAESETANAEIPPNERVAKQPIILHAEKLKSESAEDSETAEIPKRAKTDENGAPEFAEPTEKPRRGISEEDSAESSANSSAESSDFDPLAASFARNDEIENQTATNIDGTVNPNSANRETRRMDAELLKSAAEKTAKLVKNLAEKYQNDDEVLNFVNDIGGEIANLAELAQNRGADRADWAYAEISDGFSRVENKLNNPPANLEDEDLMNLKQNFRETKTYAEGKLNRDREEKSKIDEEIRAHETAENRKIYLAERAKIRAERMEKIKGGAKNALKTLGRIAIFIPTLGVSEYFISGEARKDFHNARAEAQTRKAERLERKAARIQARIDKQTAKMNDANSRAAAANSRAEMHRSKIN